MKNTIEKFILFALDGKFSDTISDILNPEMIELFCSTNKYEFRAIKTNTNTMIAPLFISILFFVLYFILEEVYNVY